MLSRQSAIASARTWCRARADAVAETSTVLCRCRKCGRSKPAIVCGRTEASLWKDNRKKSHLNSSEGKMKTSALSEREQFAFISIRSWISHQKSRLQFFMGYITYWWGRVLWCLSGLVVFLKTWTWKADECCENFRTSPRSTLRWHILPTVWMMRMHFKFHFKINSIYIFWLYNQLKYISENFTRFIWKTAILYMR